MNNSTEVPNRIQSILIVGGGTAGWMTAAALSKSLEGQHCLIRLVESDNIGTVGVGEATIPEIRSFNEKLGLNEAEFLNETKGSFKLGIEFVNWSKPGESYIHPFGYYGTEIDAIPFYHYWQKFYLRNEVPDISEFAISDVAARQAKFIHPKPKAGNSPLSNISYAYHFDANLYGRFLRKHSEHRAVKRIEGEITQVILNKDTGRIDSVELEDGQSLKADLFIDCSGFRGLLIEQALNVGVDDWSNQLMCDRAVTVASTKCDPLPPFTRATAHQAGWQWRIPLQHRSGNGHIFCSQYMSEDEATHILLNNIEGKTEGETRSLRFKTGMRKKFWYKNCVAIGLSSGFLEPLESTSIHLIYSGISKLLSLFPSKEFHQVEINKYNQLMSDEFRGIKDFLVLHYHLNQREDSDFWRDCQRLEISDTLKNKIALYSSAGRIYRDNQELFDVESWLAVMHGQGLRASSYHPLVDSQPEEAVKEFLLNVHKVIHQSVDAMPLHSSYLERLVQSHTCRDS